MISAHVGSSDDGVGRQYSAPLFLAQVHRNTHDQQRGSTDSTDKFADKELEEAQPHLSSITRLVSRFSPPLDSLFFLCSFAFTSLKHFTSHPTGQDSFLHIAHPSSDSSSTARPREAPTSA